VNLKKTSLLFLFLLTLSLAIYAIQDKTEVEKIAIEEFDIFSQNLTHNEKIFEKLFQNLDEEMHILKENSYFKNFLKNKEDRKKVELLFLEILKKIPQLHQLRYIYKDGNEIIRAQREQGSSFLVEESKLQNKKHRYYFKNIMQINSNHMYLSQIDDNIENNVVPIANDKTLRIGIQVLIEDKKEGILVANIKMEKISVREGTFLQSFRVHMHKNIYISY